MMKMKNLNTKPVFNLQWQASEGLQGLSSHKAKIGHLVDGGFRRG